MKLPKYFNTLLKHLIKIKAIKHCFKLNNFNIHIKFTKFIINLKA